MSSNPLFPNDNQDGQDRPLQIPGQDSRDNHTNPAAELIRRKLEALYAEEPSFREEIKEVKHEVPKPGGPFSSKHQEFMYNLSNSGKPLAEVQTAWHNYYTSLTDDEKKEVWEEFYEANGRTPQFFQQVASQVKAAKEAPAPLPMRPPSHTLRLAVPRDRKVVVAEHVLTAPRPTNRNRTNRVREEVIKHVTADGKLKLKHHLQSLAFGLSLGLVAIVIFLFSFFNEIIIAPFIQPSRNVSSTPLILSGDTVAVSSTPQVIIPKINVQIPVNYSVPSDNEDEIEDALEGGVVHYPSTVDPGQLGNAAFFGHSSNNIFNPGKYKFAFVLLHTLVIGDTFYLTYNGVNYVYQVFQREIVPPTDVSILNDVPGKSATAVLITCDPPGTSNNRLAVWGDQISPSPTGNSAASPTTTAIAAPAQIANNGPSLWSRLVHDIF